MKVWGTGEDARLSSTFQSSSAIGASVFPTEASLQALRQQPENAQSTRELDSLARERDPELFFAGLLHFAGRELNRERPESAALAYQAVASGARHFPKLKNLAEEGLNAMRGSGGTGARVEYLLRDLAKQSLDPALLLAMGSAGLVYKGARLASLSGLAASPAARLWLTPGGRRFAAALGGFALEAPAFTLSARGFHAALGRPQDWSREALGRDLLSSAFVLGGLKIGGAASASLQRRVGTQLPVGLSAPSTPFQQAGMLGGIYLGHGLEQAAGLKAKVDDATTFADSLVTLLQFNVAGRLTPSPWKRELARWELMAQAKNQAQPTLPRSLTPWSAPLTALAGPREAGLKSSLWMQSSSQDSDGRNSPPPLSSSQESGRSQSSKPPVEHGVILRDALDWGSRQSRSSEDVTRMVHFVERIRVEMWNVLNLFVDKPLARALGQSRVIYVRVKPADGSLDNYEIELHSRPTGREVHPDYVEFILDANQGRLKLHDLVSQAAEYNQLQLGGQDLSRSFLGYYRGILDFESPALQSAHLVAAMPAHVRTLVHQQATNYLRPALPPASEALNFPKFVRAPEPELKSTDLVDYFPYVAELARQEVESFAENAGIRGKQLFRLQSLVQKLLTGLYTRESAEPRLVRFSYLQARLKPDPEVPTKRIVEVLTPGEAMGRQPLADEVIFNVVRHPSAMGEDFAYLNHVYLRTDSRGEPIEADRRFQVDLGINFNLKMRLDSLSLESFDAQAANQWLRDNDYIAE